MCNYYVRNRPAKCLCLMSSIKLCHTRGVESTVLSSVITTSTFWSKTQPCTRYNKINGGLQLDGPKNMISFVNNSNTANSIFQAEFTRKYFILYHGIEQGKEVNCRFHAFTQIATRGSSSSLCSSHHVTR